jgi:hypothetical protein
MVVGHLTRIIRWLPHVEVAEDPSACHTDGKYDGHVFGHQPRCYLQVAFVMNIICFVLQDLMTTRRRLVKGRKLFCPLSALRSKKSMAVDLLHFSSEEVVDVC